MGSKAGDGRTSGQVLTVTRSARQGAVWRRAKLWVNKMRRKDYDTGEPEKRTVSDGREYVPDEIEFMKAMDQYKRRNQRPYPTWCEVLAVLRSLGWSKAAPAKPSVQDETEK